MALTYEVYCRFVDAMDFRPCGIDHVTIGGIASVVGAARLLGLTQEQIVEAINLTVVANIALRQTRTGNLSHWKGCAYANASRNAIFAAELAACGMTGPSPIFEGRHGFFKVVSKQPFDLAPLRRKRPTIPHHEMPSKTISDLQSRANRGAGSVRNTSTHSW